MTFIPNILSKVDVNNSSNGSISGTFIGNSTSTVGYDYITLTIDSTMSSTPNGINIYMGNDGETPEIFYTDNYQENTTYIRDFKITKNNYYLAFIPSTGSTYNLNITSRLVCSKQENTIASNPATFDYLNEYSLDAFGKLRVSNPNTLMDLNFYGQIGGETNFLNNSMLVCSESQGSFTADTSGNGYLEISGTDLGYHISQSRQFTVYQPGKSLLLLFSGVIMPNDNLGNYVSDFEGRIGYYTNNPAFDTDNTIPYNGLYYKYDGSGCSINLCNKGTITQYLQSTWNLDTMNGSGPSGINLNFYNTQLFVIDLEWLGVGRIRFGFYAYGRIHYCHQITNINQLIEPYTSNINLPVRYELIGSGISGSTAVIKQICSTVISEGGYNPLGRPFGISLSSSINISNVAAGETPILALSGGGTNYFHQNIVPKSIDIVDISKNNTNLWRIRIYQDVNPATIGISSWTPVNTTYSVSQYTSSFSGWSSSNSIIVAQGLFSGQGNVKFSDLSDIFNSQILHITSNINLVSDILVLTCQILDGSGASIYSSLIINEHY